MSIRTIIAVSLLFTVCLIGIFQKVTLSPWAWMVWGILLLVAVAGWVIVSRVVSWGVRKAIMLMPISDKLLPHASHLNIPLTEVHSSVSRIEKTIAQKMRFRPLAWLAIRAFRLKSDGFLQSIVEHCKTNGSEVFDERLFASWIHGKVAQKLSDTAAGMVSCFWIIAVFVLVSAGLFFAMPHFSLGLR